LVRDEIVWNILENCMREKRIIKKPAPKKKQAV